MKNKTIDLIVSNLDKPSDYRLAFSSPDWEKLI